MQSFLEFFYTGLVHCFFPLDPCQLSLPESKVNLEKKQQPFFIPQGRMPGSKGHNSVVCAVFAKSFTFLQGSLFVSHLDRSSPISTTGSHTCYQLLTYPFIDVCFLIALSIWKATWPCWKNWICSNDFCRSACVKWALCHFGTLTHISVVQACIVFQWACREKRKSV